MTKEEQARILLEHPDESPEIVGMLDYLIHPPSRLSSTAAWIRFRDKTLKPLIAERPEDQNLPLFLAQAEKIIAWRATIPPELRLWKRD